MPSRPPESNQVAALLQRFREAPIVVGVIGLGYVGLPLCNAFLKAGIRVLGVDIDPVKIDKLRRGEPYLETTGGEMVDRLASDPAFEPTTSFAGLSQADAILICVPTPLGKHREPDLSYVRKTTEEIGAVLRPGQLVVLESTTYPGTTREVVLPVLQGAAPELVHGTDYFVAYSPEREDPGRTSHTIQTTPKLVGGLTQAATSLASVVYGRALLELHEVATAEIAEASKILENTFRAVNIALVNEMKMLLLEMDIDIFEVIRAASTKPFGFMPFYPGPGLGGHCIPIDPFYLTWKAHEHGVATKFVELAGEVNSRMPDFVVQRTMLALNSVGKSVRDSKVLLLGMAYKKDIGDVRESPSFSIGASLIDLGATVCFSDPHVMSTHRDRNESIPIPRIELTPESVHAQDVVILLTDHTAFPYSMIAETARLIVDTRGVFPADQGGRVFPA